MVRLNRSNFVYSKTLPFFDFITTASVSFKRHNKVIILQTVHRLRQIENPQTPADHAYNARADQFLATFHRVRDLTLTAGDYFWLCNQNKSKRALQGREDTLGPAHPNTLSSVSNLADLLEAPGDGGLGRVGLSGAVEEVAGDAEGGVVIPRHLADEVAQQAAAQEHREAFLLDKIRGGASLLGTYPPDAETESAYEQYKQTHPPQV